MMLEKDFQEMKEQRIKDEIVRKSKAKFIMSEEDVQWLPLANPKPMDDEPWFTG
jgi:hypothetical protein